jgi:hypothetical protein
MHIGTAYRVELPNGDGPYTIKDPDNLYQTARQMAAVHTDNRHPSPSQSFGGWARFNGVDQRDVFGFANMQSLFGWFGGWLPRLIREGYKIVKYDNVPITHSCEDGYQLSFRKPENYS